LVKQPLVTFQHVEWDEPRFFVPVPWQGTVFYYRAAQDLLFWQDPEGQCYQLTKQAEFEHILRELHLQKLVQRYVSTHTSTTLSNGLTLPAAQPKNLG
jgi:hypothetical protein